MTSLAPLGKGDRSGAKFIEVRDELSDAVAVDEVPIKPLKALLNCLSHRATEPLLPSGRCREATEGIKLLNVISFTSLIAKSRSLDQRLLLFLICYPKNGLIFAVSFMLTMTDKNSGDPRILLQFEWTKQPDSFHCRVVLFITYCPLERFLEIIHAIGANPVVIVCSGISLM